MTYTKLIKTPKHNTIPLPKEFAHRLRLRTGQPLLVHLVEDAGLILIIPTSQRAPVKILPRRALTHSVRKRARYDRIFDSAREIITEPALFASAVIRSEALQSLRAIPSLDRSSLARRKRRIADALS